MPLYQLDRDTKHIKFQVVFVARKNSDAAKKCPSFLWDSFNFTFCRNSVWGQVHFNLPHYFMLYYNMLYYNILSVLNYDFITNAIFSIFILHIGQMFLKRYKTTHFSKVKKSFLFLNNKAWHWGVVCTICSLMSNSKLAKTISMTTQCSHHTTIALS